MINPDHMHSSHVPTVRGMAKNSFSSWLHPVLLLLTWNGVLRQELTDLIMSASSHYSCHVQVFHFRFAPIYVQLTLPSLCVWNIFDQKNYLDIICIEMLFSHRWRFWLLWSITRKVHLKRLLGVYLPLKCELSYLLQNTNPVYPKEWQIELLFLLRLTRPT